MTQATQATHGRVKEYSNDRLETLLRRLPNPASSESIHGLLNGVGKGVPVAEELKAEDGTLMGLPFAYMEDAIETIENWDLDNAPWAHLFHDPNVGLALDYGFVLGCASHTKNENGK